HLPTIDCRRSLHETHLHRFPPRQRHMAGPSRRVVHGPGGSDGTDQGGGPDEAARRVAVPHRTLPVQRRAGAYRRASGAGIGKEAMNDPFEKQVRAAAVAGWWVVLIAVGFLTLLWLLYLAVMSSHPAWLLTLWGPGVDWPFVQNVWFWAMAALKFCIWLLVLVVLWLTLWARQLRKLDRQGTK